ncbi:MAG: hypothetical protein WC795_02820 [Candidatus Paceibacterota bacterium]|jgi:hypothetical protein
MDILAHGLWVAALAKGANVKIKEEKKPSVAWAAFWGVFPDLFAFTLPFAVLILNIIFGSIKLSQIHFPFQGLRIGAEWAFQYTPYLYQISHSLVIFSAVFLIVWLIRKRVPWVMFGWALHILIDIPTHAQGFYLTPFLWPVSEYRFTHGIRWSEQWFMIVNYSSLLLVYGYFLINKSKNKIQVENHPKV